MFIIISNKFRDMTLSGLMLFSQYNIVCVCVRGRGENKPQNTFFRVWTLMETTLPALNLGQQKEIFGNLKNVI